jgi:YidC/Oxa1 family membrane protein insertase
MGAILDPLYFIVSGVMIGFHKVISLVFDPDSGITWTLSIVGLVVTIRIILIPLFVKQIKSQRAMTALQPHIKAIQNKYKDDRQKQSEEMMKLYKEHKANPVTSCLPMLAQAPIFFALFTVLNGIAHRDKSGKPDPIAHGFMDGGYLDSARLAEFFHAPIASSFMGVNSTVTVKVVTVILIAIMSASTFTTQKQLMTKGMPKMDSSNNMMLQQQKIMLYLFPVIFAVSGVNFPVGVLIYWSTTNFWTWGQQYYVIKRNPTPGSPAYEELQKKKAEKNKEGSKGATGTVLDGTNPEDGAEGTNEVKGQRKQPKKKKKK